MATPPDFVAGQVLTAAQLNKIGLWQISQTTLTAATDQNFQSVFTTDFRNYRLILELDGATVSALYFRTLVGAVVQTNNFFSVENRTQLSVGTVAVGTRSDSFGLLGAVGNLARSFYVVDVYAPQLATITAYSHQGTFGRSATDGDLYLGMASNRVTTQCDGFRLTTAGAANITGVVTIYGYH